MRHRPAVAIGSCAGGPPPLVSAVSPPPTLPARVPPEGAARNLSSVFQQVRPTLRLVWEADRPGTLVIVALTLVVALLPPAIAWVGKLIIDAVVAAAREAGSAPELVAPFRQRVFMLVGVELGLLVLQTFVSRTLGLMRELLRGKLGNLINLRILEKALELELRHFEDAETYDKMQNARREASSRPLVAGDAVACRSVRTWSPSPRFAVLLWRVSPWSVLVLVAGLDPGVHRRGAARRASRFRLYSWRAPEGRKLNYLEWILTRDFHVKEVKLFGLGRADPRPLPGAVREVLRRGPQARGAARGVGLRRWGCSRSRRSTAATRWWPDGRRAGRSPSATWRSTSRSSARARPRSRRSSPRWVRCTKTRSSCRTCSRSSRCPPTASAPGSPTPLSLPARTAPRHRVPRRLLPLPGQGGLGAARRQPPHRDRARSSRWWARTARARPRW